ncbi:hypothetical protein F3K43_12530 [Streptomyces sp. LBUM 1476]|nr:hypothetical protein [Streptomyces sp. LBUM 1476]
MSAQERGGDGRTADVQRGRRRRGPWRGDGFEADGVPYGGVEHVVFAQEGRGELKAARVVLTRWSGVVAENVIRVWFRPEFAHRTYRSSAE